MAAWLNGLVTMQRSRRVVFLTTESAKDTRGFSGTLFYAYAALGKTEGISVSNVSLRPLRNLVRGFNKLMEFATGKKVDYSWHPVFTRIAGVCANLAVKTARPDLIVALAGSRYLAGLRTHVPIVYASDATFAAISELYPAYQSWPAWARKNAEASERRSLGIADRIVMSSEWARRSAIEDYDVPAWKVEVVPYGANLPTGLLEMKHKCPEENAVCRLLFIGMDWERKGGDFVLGVHNALLGLGVDSTLDIVGPAPERVRRVPKVSLYGKLSKENDEDLATLISLWKRAHFFVLPTVADATPIVFSEAASFGVPSITFDVGGTSDAVGWGGRTFSLGDSPQSIALFISECWKAPEKYESLSKLSVRYAAEKANWSMWVSNVLGS
nr:glycosyltransferase family 4 protein [uncultured Devosia sp.]